MLSGSGYKLRMDHFMQVKRSVDPSTVEKNVDFHDFGVIITAHSVQQIKLLAALSTLAPWWHVLGKRGNWKILTCHNVLFHS